MQKTLFMETTKIPASETVSEIQKVLGNYGASAILIEYEECQASSISFEITLNGNRIPFRLPCRTKPVEEFLDKKHKPRKYYYAGQLKFQSNKDQARRVAWRQILRWVEAQLALVSTGMVSIQEVFLPYVEIGHGEDGKPRTLFDKVSDQKFIEYKEE